MSLPRSNYDPRRVFLFDFPKLKLGPKKKEIGIYAAGALFAIGWWIFIDAIILSARAQPSPENPYEPVPVHMTGSDWISGIISTFGMLLVVLIDKSRLSSEGSGAWSSDGSTAWRARLVLFLGFAMLAGGLAGSIARLIIKYILPAYPAQYTYYGIASVAQSAGIMLSSVVIYAAQMVGEDDYEYNINL